MLKKLLLWLAGYLQTLQSKPFVLLEVPTDFSEGDRQSIAYDIGVFKRIGIYGIIDGTSFYTEGYIKSDYTILLEHTSIFNSIKVASINMYTRTSNDNYYTEVKVERSRKGNLSTAPPTYTSITLTINKIVAFYD